MLGLMPMEDKDFAIQNGRSKISQQFSNVGNVPALLPDSFSFPSHNPQIRVLKLQSVSESSAGLVNFQNAKSQPLSFCFCMSGNLIFKTRLQVILMLPVERSHLQNTTPEVSSLITLSSTYNQNFKIHITNLEITFKLQTLISIKFPNLKSIRCSNMYTTEFLIINFSPRLVPSSLFYLMLSHYSN